MRFVTALILTTLSLTGCTDPEMERRVADLETRVQAIEAAPAAPAARGKAGKGAKMANAEDEQAAAGLLKEANQMSETGDYDGAKAKIAELKAKYGDTRAARAAQRLESELKIIGAPAGELEVEKFYVSNSSMNDGNATLLVFWEVWCPHCKREVPKIQGTHDKYKGRGLNVVGLTKQTRNITDKQVEDFIKEKGITYPIAKESGDAMSRRFGVRGIPAAAVVKDGKVVWRGHPARITDSMIEDWIGS